MSLGNATANPSTTLTNTALFYASAGEMYVYDAAGNATKISPHNQEGQWIFTSENKVTGRSIEINMESVIRAVEQLSGQTFIYEQINGLPTTGLELDEEGNLALGNSIPTELSGQEQDSLLTTFTQGLKQTLSSLGIVIDKGITRIENLFTREITTEIISSEIAKINKIEMVDQSTGELYCTWIENGEWVKYKSSCEDLTGLDAQISNPNQTQDLDGQAEEVPILEEPIPEEQVPEPAPEPVLEECPEEPTPIGPVLEEQPSIQEGPVPVL